MLHRFLLVTERGPVVLRVDRRQTNHQAACMVLALMVRAGLHDRKLVARGRPMALDLRFGWCS